jgi:signal transduction histidine kinase/DNA-binding response OmpR family regulator
MNDLPKILIIDAEPMIPDGFEQLLMDLGYTVHICHDGFNIMEYLEKDNFDLLLLDLGVSQLDGYRIIEKIRRLRPETFVIMMSEHASVESAVDALKRGAYDFLKKPLTHEEILKPVQNAMLHKRSENFQKQTEDKLRRNYDKQTVVSTLLRYSLEDIGVEELLNRALELILSISWLSLKKQGCIFLVENDSETLTMKAQSRLADQIKKACVSLPFGKCHCGRAALTQKIQYSDCVDENHEIRYNGIIPHGHYCVPILFHNETLGVINLYIREGHQRDHREEEFLVAVANTLAGIIRRKRLEQALINSERLAAIGQTVAGLAHCIKNILHPLEGGIYVVEKGFRKDDMSKLQTGWGMVRRNIEKVSNLALDMLDFSDEHKPEYKSCSPNDIADEVCALMVTWLNNTAMADIQIIRDFSYKIGHAYLNPKGIHRCLINLVSNAIDACLYDADKGKIHQVKVATRIEGDETIIFQISDNGCGINEEVKSQLFTTFFSTKGSKGTGLGLLVTQKIVQEHGGDLIVESSPEQGTTFTIRIPRKLSKN